MKNQIKCLLLGLLSMSLASCAGAGAYGKNDNGGGVYYQGGEQSLTWEQPEADMDIQTPGATIENPYVKVDENNNKSNVSLTSTSFAYPTIRESIDNHRVYNLSNQVKTEEMLNYFSYDYQNDTDDALTTHLELDVCPWNNEHYLASVVVNAKPAITNDVKNNIVILVDRSGSMTGIFNLVKTSLKTLVENIGDDDKVSIVSYASGCKVEIEGKTGKDKNELNNVIDNLKASGSTWGEGGIEKAYEIAYKYFIDGGNNRVVILTDGDFNVGKVSGEELTALIKTKAADGVYLTCCGYRSYDNGTLYALADNGNGNAYYIDGELEAKKVFEEELGKSMYVVAKDAKCQIEFSKSVSSYRLIGYETRQMTNDEFEDDKKDAGEIMSGHTTVALYELELREESAEDYIFKTTLRYKDPITFDNKEVINSKAALGVEKELEYDFASYVAEFALVLLDSKYKGQSSIDHLLERVNEAAINDKYRDDFIRVVNLYKDYSK